MNDGVEPAAWDLSDGIRLTGWAAGERDRPLLIFLHGFPEAAFIWREMLAHFALPEHGGYRCVAPNLRGYADSSAPSEVASYRAGALVQDILGLAEQEVIGGGTMACLVAHDWGGAVAWTLANRHPRRLERLMIINSPHPGTFLRELKSNPVQQAASAYMNFLIRTDADALLRADDYRRMWPFFTGMGADLAADSPGAPRGGGWLTPAVRDQFRAVWRHGLDGALNYYRASPLRPPRPEDPAAAAIDLPPAAVEVRVPTQVLWALGDIALGASLLDGLATHVPDLRVRTVEDATHWILHEQPDVLRDTLAAFLAETPRRA